MKIKINFIPNLKIFDIVEFSNGDTEWTIFFTKLYFGKNVTRYYFDSVGVGLDFNKNKLKKSICLHLILFSVQIAIETNSNLRVVNG